MEFTYKIHRLIYIYVVLSLICELLSTFVPASCPDGMLSLLNAISCTNDMTCQALATGFFCLRGRCCAQITPPPGGYGISCLNDDQCTMHNSQCSQNICYCKPGFNYNGEDSCIPRVLYDVPPSHQSIQPGGCAPGQVRVHDNCYGYVGFGGFCDSTQQCNFVGGVCEANRCGCATGQVFDGVACINDPKIISKVACGIGQTRINDVCYPIVGPGEMCAFDMQCRSPIPERGIFCDNFVCRFADLRQWSPYLIETEFPICRNPSAEVELQNSIPKDCIYQRCSLGFHCEFNVVYKGGQYICCGAYPNNPIFGQIKMYPGYTNLPLRCKAINSCTFMDYPFCVYSESYRHRVCCSKPQCL